MKFKLKTVGLLAAMSLVYLSGCTSMPDPRVVHGTTEVMVGGELQSYESETVIRVYVPADQGLAVEQVIAEDDFRMVTLHLLDPDGNDVSDMAASCNRKQSIPKTVAGDYAVKVTACGKVDPWSGPFDLRVRVGNITE